MKRAACSAVGITLAATMAAGVRAQPPSLLPQSARECAVCHLEWVETSGRPGAVVLIDIPEEITAAHSETCLGCHDGSVADSRERVWANDHGHRTGVRPPPEMKVPRDLPLEDGKIACRTCHTAHASPAAQETLATAVFLRMPNQASELCMACHADKTKGPELGTHPIGGMPWAVPERLIEAGARVGPDRFRLICQTCHTPHGAREEHLLVMGASRSELCLTCHEPLRPGLWRPDVQREHPLNPPLQTEAQRRAIAEMGTRLGPGDTLVCLSCHKLHHGQAGRYMLADTLAESRLCLRCHPERRAMVGSAHDLRITAPEETNRLGMTPDASGPCGACHSFHQFARTPEPGPGDPTGMCLTCHRSGGCAGSGITVAHPTRIGTQDIPPDAGLTLYPAPGGPDSRTLACLTCHDPHHIEENHFLRFPEDVVCGQCHQEQATTLAGAHDFTARPDVCNALGRGPEEVGRCGICHSVHSALGPALWVATAAAPQSGNDLCTSCHRPGGVAGEKAPAQWGYTHPTGPQAVVAETSVQQWLPLFDEAGGRDPEGGVACPSCHSPHADSTANPAMLREGPAATRLCTACHAEKENLLGGRHDIMVAVSGDGKPSQAPWPAASREAGDTCLACHRPHGADALAGAWRAGMTEPAATSDGACLVCHSDRAWHTGDQTPPVGSTVHPQEGRPVRWPEHPADASASPVITITDAGDLLVRCASCHDPHAAPAGARHMLRAERGAEFEACAACHTEARSLETSLHSPDHVAQIPWAQQEEDPCAVRHCNPCHAVHAEAGPERPVVAAIGGGPLPPGAERCLVCHQEGGGGPVVRLVRHPAILAWNPGDPADPGFLPLVDAGGRPAAAGQIGCLTCHEPHGRPPETLPAAAAGADPVAIRQMMPMIRAYRPPNLCSTCHGADGLVRFLYYHYPERRTTSAASLPHRARRGLGPPGSPLPR